MQSQLHKGEKGIKEYITSFVVVVVVVQRDASTMTTVVLRLEKSDKCSPYTPISRIPDNVKNRMSLPRDNVPAQLPKVPLEVWQKFWDDVAKQITAHLIRMREFTFCIPPGSSPCFATTMINISIALWPLNVLRIVIVGSCIGISKEGKEMVGKLLTTHQPEFAKYGVELNYKKDQNGKFDGFILKNGAAATEAVAIPVASVSVAIPAAQEMHRGGNSEAATAVPLMPLYTAPARTAADRLEELQGLLKKGLINESDFAAKKQEILNSV